MHRTGHFERNDIPCARLLEQPGRLADSARTQQVRDGPGAVALFHAIERVDVGVVGVRAVARHLAQHRAHLAAQLAGFDVAFPNGPIRAGARPDDTIVTACV